MADAVLDFVCGEHEESNERVLSTVLFMEHRQFDRIAQRSR